MLQNNLIYKTITRIFKLLPSSYKKRSGFQLVLMIVNSFVDLLGLAAVIPLLAALLKVGFIHENHLLNTVYTSLGFTEDKWFIVFICGVVLAIVIAKNAFGLWVNKRQMYFSGQMYTLAKKYSQIFTKKDLVTLIIKTQIRSKTTLYAFLKTSLQWLILGYFSL